MSRVLPQHPQHRATQQSSRQTARRGKEWVPCQIVKFSNCRYDVCIFYYAIFSQLNMFMLRLVIFGGIMLWYNGFFKTLLVKKKKPCWHSKSNYDVSANARLLHDIVYCVRFCLLPGGSLDVETAAVAQCRHSTRDTRGLPSLLQLRRTVRRVLGEHSTVV